MIEMSQLPDKEETLSGKQKHCWRTRGACLTAHSSRSILYETGFISDIDIRSKEKKAGAKNLGEQGKKARRTIQDIARLAGVSKATVSRVLNQRTNVDAVTRERVLQIMKEQDFVPSATARGLAGGRNQLIGVLTPPLTWPTVPEIMRGIAEVIERTSYEIVLYSISPERNHSDILDRILGLQLTSGLLAILPGLLSEHMAELYAGGLPIVTIDDQGEPVATPWVGVDNVAAAREATRYLIELGHSRIAHIQGPLEFRCSHERYEGYCQALLEAGITPDPSLVVQGSFEITGGKTAARQIFSLAPHERPTAIFVGNDQTAYGVLDVAEESGMRIPEDISVVGFDDIPLSALMKPPLTTIHQPFIEMGQKAVELLLTLIDPEYLPASEEVSQQETEPDSETTENASRCEKLPQIELDTYLVVRESSRTR
jgi:LacI family transcriptional regulator